MNFDILVAKCCRSVGLKGHLKLVVYTDFIDIFQSNNILFCNGKELVVESFSSNRNIIKFFEINTIDDAKSLISFNLYTTKDATSKICKLNDGEFFWFDIVGLNIIDNGVFLGNIEDIERMGNIDYFIVKTASNKFLKPKKFMIPYIDRYVINIDLFKKIVYTRDAIGILETS